jgi:hypothetical protein
VRARALLVLLALGGVARAEEPPPVTWHGSIAAGGSLLLTGDGGDATRFDGSISFQPFRRFGFVAAVRAIDGEPRSAIVTAGVEYQAAASRPRLVLSLYADAGLETAERSPVVGGGLRTTFRLFGPLGLVGDTGFHLVVDGVDDSRLVIGSALMLAVIR